MNQNRFVVSVVLAAFSVLFAFHILSPFLEEGYSVAGDDCVHISYSRALREMVLERGKPFGWSYIYGTGAPIFVFRPPGFYLSAVALDLISGGFLGLETAHKLIYVLALALYPLAVYYLLSKFRFPFLVRGLGSLLALAPVSTWGHTLDAYFDLGLAKQALALLIFPFVLGKLHGIMRRREAVFPGALLFGFAFLNHPYMALSVTWCTGLYLIVHLVSFSLRETLHALIRAVSVFVLGALLISFWLIPFYSSPEIHPTTGYLSQSRHGFSVMTDTAAGTISHFLDGSLFDAPAPEPFGAGSVWAWRDNSFTGRWPALTWSCLLGLIFLLAGFRYFKNLYFFCGFIFSFLVFLGPDDLPVLRLIPFQEQFQYIHWIPVPEMFAVCAAAVGIGSLPEFLAGIIPSRFRLSRWLFWPVFSALTVFFVFPVWRDRLEWGKLKVRTRAFSTRDGKQTARSLRNGANRDFQQCLDVLAAGETFSRFYASPTSIRAGQEIFYFTVAPALAGRANVISPLFSGLVGGWNRVIGSSIRKDLWQSRNLLELLNIRHLITHRDNLEKFSPLPDFWEEEISSGTWRMYDFPGGRGSFGFTGCPPLLAFLDYHDWEELMRSWAEYYRSRPEPSSAVFALRAPGGDRPVPAPDILARCGGILVPGGPAWSEGAGAELVARARSRGLPVYGMAPVPGGQTIQDVGGVPWEELEKDIADWRQEKTAEAPERHRLEFWAARGGWVYFKASFYRGWKVLLDGCPVANWCLSPGYNAAFVPAGTHSVEFAYRGANRSGWGYLVSLLALAGGLISVLVGRRRRREGE